MYSPEPSNSQTALTAFPRTHRSSSSHSNSPLSFSPHLSLRISLFCVSPGHPFSSPMAGPWARPPQSPGNERSNCFLTPPVCSSTQPLTGFCHSSSFLSLFLPLPSFPFYVISSVLFSLFPFPSSSFQRTMYIIIVKQNFSMKIIHEQRVALTALTAL